MQAKRRDLKIHENGQYAVAYWGDSNSNNGTPIAGMSGV